MIRLKSLAYTSLARPELEPADLRAIHQAARHLNALDGITGLLIYNGRQFLQVIEGAESAIDDLLGRLLADSRHSELTVEDRRFLDDREFPDWAMELVQFRIGSLKGHSDIVDFLPASLPETIRVKVAEMAASQA